MPRTPRIKSDTAIYHIMARSISEVRLFRSNDDKNKFLSYLKKYKDMFSFHVYGFCLMDNHLHLLINSNGADISKFMHNINQCYAQYYNRKYNRTGHVFGDRFKSRIADTDLSVMLISAYIHNNPKDIKGFKQHVENYKYSSLGIYLGKWQDEFKIIDKDFILQYFNQDPILAIVRYFEFVKSRTKTDIDDNIIDDLELVNTCTVYKSYSKPLIRNINPQQIIEFVSSSYNFNKSDINIKYNHSASEFRSICIFLMRNLCNLYYAEICDIIGNITLSSISYLCNKGYNIVHNTSKYHNIINEFLEKSSVCF
ncbi:transposase [Clostridium sp.]|uniref:transposase n=1 Tax=Clostridium sp. TaxID=1506 RepID=UPI0039F48BB6